MAAEKRAASPRRLATRREAAPDGDTLRQLQILNDRICQVMEALRRLNDAPPRDRLVPPGGPLVG